MPLGAIVVREPQSDAFRGLENLLVGAAGGYDKRQRRKQLISGFPADKQAAFDQLPTPILEQMAQAQAQQQTMQMLNPAAFQSRQNMDQIRQNVTGQFLQQVQGSQPQAGPVQPPGGAATGVLPGQGIGNQSNGMLNQMLYQMLGLQQPGFTERLFKSLPPEDKEVARRSLTGAAPRSTRPAKPVTVRFEQQMQGGSKQKRRVLVPAEQANEIERIANTYQTVDPQEIFDSQLFALEDDNAGFASAIDTASALPDYVKAAVVMNKARATDAIDSYFDLWQQERDKRGVFRDDVVPDLPAEEKIVAMKLEAVMGYLDDETAGELMNILDEGSPEEMRETWETLSNQ